MLPLTIKQNDLPGLVHTNAEVLVYLLQPRNREFVLAARYNEITGTETRMDEHDLLKRIHLSGIRVLIDAGAQILEMNNLQLVKAWLEIDTEAPAAVYFDDNNKACICYRQGKIMPLLASSFADDLSECLVYLVRSFYASFQYSCLKTLALDPKIPKPSSYSLVRSHTC
jgi:uncharacterized protein related to proFAR isomerase